jgi:ABC-2 type transport system ATP-binding protein
MRRRLDIAMSLIGNPPVIADRIAILHEGTIIVSGTLADLRKLLPPARVEYVERQATLEEVFLSVVGKQA